MRLAVDLAQALGDDSWQDWRLLNDDGVTVSGFRRPATPFDSPEGYVLDAGGRYLQRD